MLALTAALATSAAIIIYIPEAAPAVLGAASGLSVAALAVEAEGDDLHIAATAAALLAIMHLIVVVIVR